MPWQASIWGQMCGCRPPFSPVPFPQHGSDRTQLWHGHVAFLCCLGTRRDWFFIMEGTREQSGWEQGTDICPRAGRLCLSLTCRTQFGGLRGHSCLVQKGNCFSFPGEYLKQFRFSALYGGEGIFLIEDRAVWVCYGCPNNHKLCDLNHRNVSSHSSGASLWPVEGHPLFKASYHLPYRCVYISFLGVESRASCILASLGWSLTRICLGQSLGKTDWNSSAKLPRDVPRDPCEVPPPTWLLLSVRGDIPIRKNLTPLIVFFKNNSHYSSPKVIFKLFVTRVFFFF